MHDNTPSIHDLIRPTGRLTEVTSTSTSDGQAESDDEITQIARCRVSRRPVMMIAFRKCNGVVLVLPYSMLKRIVSDDPDRKLRFQFTDEQIELEGDHLTQLFHYACEQRVIEMVESSRSQILENDSECVVSKILVRDS